MLTDAPRTPALLNRHPKGYKNVSVTRACTHPLCMHLVVLMYVYSSSCAHLLVLNCSYSSTCAHLLVLILFYSTACTHLLVLIFFYSTACTHQLVLIYLYSSTSALIYRFEQTDTTAVQCLACQLGKYSIAINPSSCRYPLTDADVCRRMLKYSALAEYLNSALIQQ